jgi:hypothetical protein
VIFVTMFRDVFMRSVGRVLRYDDTQRTRNKMYRRNWESNLGPPARVF